MYIFDLSNSERYIKISQYNFFLSNSAYINRDLVAPIIYIVIKGADDSDLLIIFITFFLNHSGLFKEILFIIMKAY